MNFRKNLLQTVLCSIIMFTVMLPASSQDLLVTKDNDSINCKIIKIDHGVLYYSWLRNGKINNTIRPITELKTYKNNFVNVRNVSITSNNFICNPDSVENQGFSSLRFSLDFGWAYRTAKLSGSVPDPLKDYSNKLQYLPNS